MYFQSGLLLIYVNYKRKDANSARAVYNSIAASPVVKSMTTNRDGAKGNKNNIQVLLGTFKKLLHDR